ncbi:carbohydrate kinase family protein [Streptomyces sp. TRM66268-LWL]|uniref:Carbohydrate kinase family protein n=1 Tax=Streptomyces polyasparticus TaxID=2767826 RepID=A0ABR7SCH5_9ACTN|nr:carbohydrate kinase family protein [Streptomyces polyasparticus]MBC9712682.1 carbohydrate kinase family protein [Streptomyces polyasparticus]
MPHQYDLLVIGDANPDVILGPLDGPLAFGQREQLVAAGSFTVGGSAAIMACGAARLGLRVAFAGRVGDDDAGRYLRDTLAARGVDTRGLRRDPDRPTPLTVVLTRGDDRAVLTSPGTLTAVSGADVPDELLAASRHVHSSSYFLQPRLAADLPAVLRAARSHGATTSLDTQDDPSDRWQGLDAVLAQTDILLPNAQEALRLAGPAASTVREAAELLAARGPLTVVKNGADGALCHDGRVLCTVPGLPVEVMDTVGAGDSFDAGFIAATLDGRPAPEALRFAVVCGALSTRAHGGTPAQPTWDEALAHLTRTGAPLV